MSEENDSRKKGFAGLSDMTSDVRGIDELQNPKPETVAKPSTPNLPPQPRREDPSPPPKKHSSSPPPRLEQARSNKPSGGSAGKWMFGIFAVILVLCLIIAQDDGQSTRKSSYNPPAPTQSYNQPRSTPSPTVTAPSSGQLQYTKPSVGTNNVLSMAEIRWCVREGIRIEAMRDVVDTDEGIDEFNRLVEDYNCRCGSYRYREGSQSRAEREVEAFRGKIEAEAIQEAKNLGWTYQSSYEPPSIDFPGAISLTPRDPQGKNDSLQTPAQLDESPEVIDDNHGDQITDATEAIQSQGKPINSGSNDAEGESRSQVAVATDNSSATAQPESQNQTSFQARRGNPSRTYGAGSRRRSSFGSDSSPNDSSQPTDPVADFFTRGSHEDEVLRIQGRPNDISIYSASGYEDWKYGYSSVKISTRDRKVLFWDNAGNLKVKMLPGSNTTSAPYFTRGSHQDDVLRVQGTPDEISLYNASGYEDWKYGYSSVKISTRDRRVLNWDNSGNLKVR